MWRFHRYYIKELLLNMSLTFVMLFGISLLALIARGIYRSQGADLVIALLITLLWTVDAIPHLLGISILVGSVFTFGRAAADNEITAMRMAGISPVRLMGAVLFVGAMTAGVNGLLLHHVIPVVHYKKYRPSQDLLIVVLTTVKPSQNRWEFGERLTMTWERREGMRYYDVNFRAKSRQGRYFGFAREVGINQDATGEVLSLTVHDFEGRFPNGEGSTRHAKLEQVTLEFYLRELVEKGKRHEGMKDVSTAQLVSEAMGGLSERPIEAWWYIWLRSCQALASLFFALIGFPIGVVFRRAGRMVSFAISFIPLALYYGLMYTAPWISKETQSVWPVFLPNLGLLTLTILLARKAFRQ